MTKVWPRYGPKAIDRLTPAAPIENGRWCLHPMLQKGWVSAPSGFCWGFLKHNQEMIDPIKWRLNFLILTGSISYDWALQYDIESCIDPIMFLSWKQYHTNHGLFTSSMYRFVSMKNQSIFHGNLSNETNPWNCFSSIHTKLQCHPFIFSIQPLQNLVKKPIDTTVIAW